MALMSLRLTSNIVPMNLSVVFLVGANIISALIFWLFTLTKGVRAKVEYDSSDLFEMNRFLKYLLVFWALGSLVDIAYSGGLPILWAAMGSDKNYTDFGVRSFHGIVNACYLFGVTILSVQIFYEKKPRKIVLMGLLCWPILMLGRGILLSALVQIAAVYLLLRPVGVKRLSLIGLVIFLCIVMFGVVGNYRGTSNPFDYLLTEESSQALFGFLPDGFLWFYVYITTGLNNIAFSINLIEPNYTPYYSVINLLPSFLRFNIEDYVLNGSLVELVDENLNTSTFYSGYLSDFGLFGAFLAGVSLQLLAVICYRKARRGNVSAVLAYSIVFECVVFSIFYDMFLLLPYLLQILMAFYLMNRCVRAKRKKLYV